MGLGLMGKLGHAWVGAWVVYGMVHGMVHGWCMGVWLGDVGDMWWGWEKVQHLPLKSCSFEKNR